MYLYFPQIHRRIWHLIAIIPRFRWNFLSNQKLAPVALHLSLTIVVAIYIIAGAFAIRKIEAFTIYPNSSIKYGSNNADRNTAIKELLQEQFKKCFMEVYSKIKRMNKCDQIAIAKLMSSTIRNCRQPEDLNEFLNPVGDIIEESKSKKNGNPVVYQWSITDAIIFCFTVITTIGYGNVTPKTNHGRIFVIIYGLIGIPLSMLAIANLGKFLSAFLKRWTKSAVKNFRNFFETGRKRFRSKEKQALVNYNDIHDVNKRMNDDKSNDEIDVGSWLDAIVLLSAFFLYLIVGSVLIAAYEKEMDFFGAIYFNFVSLTTIGLGDLIPKNENYLAFTIIYCIVGLSLTTIAIEIASEYLKKLHFFGRKLENVGNVQVWFGGKMLTMKQLVRNLGDQFNLPENQIIDLNLDQFVDDALKVEAGELPTLRRNPLNDLSSLLYMDDDDFYTNSSRYSITRI